MARSRPGMVDNDNVYALIDCQTTYLPSIWFLFYHISSNLKPHNYMTEDTKKAIKKTGRSYLRHGQNAV